MTRAKNGTCPSKVDGEFMRGRNRGYAGGMDHVSRHGVVKAKRDGTILEVEATAKTADSFDRGYWRGYLDALDHMPIKDLT